MRADWDVVQAQVRRLVVAAENAKTPKAHKDKIEEAREAVREFQKKLCHTRVLDPACGSGNFLYVALDLFKRLEGEVLSLLESLGEKQTLLHMQSVRVTPEQFHGIEVKRWAKEIAELVLWIGYLQWHFRMYGKSMPVPEPVLRDYKNIECRDAVLAYDGEPELARDEKGKPLTRWDGKTTKTNPVTGEQVPDESARVLVYTTGTRARPNGQRPISSWRIRHISATSRCDRTLAMVTLRRFGQHGRTSRSRATW